MPSINRSSVFRSVLVSASFAFLLDGLSACKTVDLSDATTTTPPQDSTGTATLRITNSIDIDPDSLVFYLFPGSSTDFTTAANGKKIGGVGVGATGVFTVPAGTWKLAYENGAHVLTAMRADATDEWVKSILEKNGDYSLILTTFNQNTVWDPTFQTDPSLK